MGLVLLWVPQPVIPHSPDEAVGPGGKVVKLVDPTDGNAGVKARASFVQPRGETTTRVARPPLDAQGAAGPGR